jgi:SH3 domain-containing YSC84-like protein 1
MLVMNEQGLDQLLSSKLELSVEGSVVAGPVGRDAAVGSNPNLNAEMLTYSLSKGLFAGQALEGAVIGQDSDATKAAYGDNTSFRQILTGGVPAPASAKPFLQAVMSMSHASVALQAQQK